MLNAQSAEFRLMNYHSNQHRTDRSIVEIAIINVKYKVKYNEQMKISLNIAQRIQLVSFLNSFQGKSYETLVHVWKLIEKVSIGEDEKKTIGMKVDGNQIIWDASKSSDLVVDFSSDEVRVFGDEFEKVSKENKLDVSQYNLAQVYIKLNVKQDGIEQFEQLEQSEASGL